jgi:hypothetical protein
VDGWLSGWVDEVDESGWAKRWAGLAGLAHPPCCAALRCTARSLWLSGSLALGLL